MSKTFEFGRSFPSDTLRFELTSGDDKDRKDCRLTIAVLGWRLSIALPTVIKPWAQCHPSTVSPGGIWVELHRRKYGFYIHENSHFYVYLGPQTNDSTTTKSWSCFLPWTQWRLVRHTYYDLNANAFWQDIRGPNNRMAKFEEQYEAEKLCPKAAFELLDYDGAKIIATTVIEEREWLRGEKWCKWLSWFYKPMVRRSLKIDFSAETGTEKGSWKGGITGTSIEILPGEMHESAMCRYCDKEQRAKYKNYRIQFVKPI